MPLGGKVYREVEVMDIAQKMLRAQRREIVLLKRENLHFRLRNERLAKANTQLINASNTWAAKYATAIGGYPLCDAHNAAAAAKWEADKNHARDRG